MPTGLAEALDTAMDKAIQDNSTGLAKPAAVAAEPVKAPETTPETPAPATEAPATATPEKPQEPAPATEVPEQEQLLTKEDHAEIQKNPLLAKAYKLLQGTFTQKTQALAEARKAIDPYQPLIDSWKKDPQETVRMLAKQAGMDLAPNNGEVKPGGPALDTLAILKESLPPELSFLADSLAPAIERIVKARTGESVAPLQKFQQDLVAETAARETATLMEAFSKTHPDYVKHEPKMVSLMGQLEPKGMEQREYLEMIWTLATRDTKEADSIKSVVAKINAAAAKTESPDAGVAAERVVSTPPKFVSMNDAVDQAIAAARRGERWGQSSA